MATNSKFVKLSENDINEFCEQQENENTTKKTLYDISIFKEFISAYYSTEYREIEDISPTKLRTADFKEICFGCTKERQ